MNEQLEIGGDLRDEWLEMKEGEEVLSQATSPHTLTTEDLDDWYQNLGAI